VSEAVRACLVHTPCHGLRDDRLEPPLGLLYVASYARCSGYEVVVVDLSSQPSEGLIDRIPDNFDVYGFSTYSATFGLTHELAAATRARNPRALYVAGGPHATALPEKVLAAGFNIVVRGEGELAFAELLEAASAGQPVRPVLDGTPPAPLDALPLPDYELVDLDTYTRELDGHRCISVLTSRGCPYRCTFCNSTIMGAGRPIRYRGAESVVRELRYLRETYGTRHFRFQDDTFTVDRRRVRELTDHLRDEDIVYRCFARVNTFSANMAGLLRSGGCVHVSFGVETGSPKLLGTSAMHKNQTPEQVRRALLNAHEAGIRARIFLIVGFPGETDRTIEETLALVKSVPWDEFSVYPLIAYPGTALHERPEEFGITWINKDYSEYLQIGNDFRAGFTIRTAEFDERDVCAWRDRVISELLADGRAWAGDAGGYR
jgi:anaerobic magnesium-protoporphyrin IX monomethyl ester cyclase